MADDAWHHLEGTYPGPGLFRVFFYDDWTRPLPPEGFSARAIIKDSAGKEVSTVPLTTSKLPDSNAMDAQINASVEKLGAPFHRVYTAQQAQAYKPRLQAFEYMLDSLGCNPEDVLHVSSSLRYDLMSADDLGIVDKVFVNRGHGPGNPAYRYTEIRDIGGLPAVVGL